MGIFHRHRWRPVQAEPMRVTKSGPSGRAWHAKGELVTQVVYRCQCGRISHELVPGTWTVESLEAS